MIYNNKVFLKNKSIELYLQGKSMNEIASSLKCSRNYVSTLIKDDPKVIEFKNKSIVKVFKHKNQKRMSVPISTNFLKKIGISDEINKDEYVDIIVDEKEKKITIKKHK